MDSEQVLNLAALITTLIKNCLTFEMKQPKAFKFLLIKQKWIRFASA